MLLLSFILVPFPVRQLRAWVVPTGLVPVGTDSGEAGFLGINLGSTGTSPVGASARAQLVNQRRY